jgi:hypothetical protein
LIALLVFAVWAIGGIIRDVFQQPPSSAYGTTPNQHPEYADTDGDGFVPAQGDPLYDEYYAKNVNNPNSQALETLGDAEINQAQAEQIRAETEQMRVGTVLTYAVLGVVVLILLIVVWAKLQ